MAINKKLIHFKNKTKFDEELAKNNINDTSICFIKDTQQIWTHGQLYSCNVDISTLSDVLRVDSESILNKDRIIVSGEYTNAYGNVAYSYGNSDQGLLFTNTQTTQEALETHVFTVDNGIELGTIKTYDGQDPDNTTHATVSGIYVGEGSITLHNIEVDQDLYTQIFCTMDDGNFYVQRIIEGPENSNPVAMISLTETGVQLASGFTNSEQSHSLVITPEGIFLNGQYIDKYISTSYDNLKTLRDNAHLVPGAMYRLTDYECTTTQEDTASAGHQFDIILTAIAPDTLSEECKAIQNENDDYFNTDNLSAWKVWYALDNDKSRFYWADEENGKGVIYRMIDENNNDLPYDFKNILYIENNPVYDQNTLGSEISLDNPLEISYTLISDSDTEYTSKDDVIVEMNLSTESPDKQGEEVWVLYKTDLEGYPDEGVDYGDMFVFVDKYEYNGQTWDRWRKAESDGSAYQWIEHNGGAIYILTEELLEETSNEQIMRYTFNAEWVEGYDSIDASRSFYAPTQAHDNVMKGCSVAPESSDSQWYLPRNIFILQGQYDNVTHNNFDFSVSNNTFIGRSEFLTIGQICFGNTFYDPYLCTLGSYCIYNTFNDCTALAISGYNAQNYFQLSNSNACACVVNNHITGSELTIDSGVLNCVINTDLAIISPMQHTTKTVIEVPEHSYQIKIAQNSRGEIKIYNEADLIA